MLDQQKQTVLESIVLKGLCPCCQSKKLIYSEVGQNELFNCCQCGYQVKFKDSDFDEQDFVQLYS